MREEAKRRGLSLPGQTRRFDCYRDNPNGYAVDILKQVWWDKQREIAQALVDHKKVAVKACHSIGKSHLAGGLVNWYFDCFDPGIVLTTAPTSAQVNDILWRRVREQRPGKTDLQPKAARMETGDCHFAAGYTARDSNAFQGRHEERLLIIFDEADGIDTQFFDAAEGMVTGPLNRWLCIYNPIESASRMMAEEEGGEWHVISVSALEHPNLAAKLRGDPMPYPKAVSLEWVEERIDKWCSTVDGSHKAIDFEWPPESGLWYRPGPMFESRVLGRRPSSAVDTVWSDALWMASLKPQPLPDHPTAIGCDVARFGDDETTIYVGRGACVLHAESHNGWDTAETAGRLKRLAREWKGEGEEPETIAIHIDDDGVGGGVVDQGDNFNFLGCSGGVRARVPEDYPNRRSEVWFVVAEQADEGRIDLSRLPEDRRKALRSELLSAKYKLDSQGRRVVEPKSETKKRIKRSPDNADGFNLLFAGPASLPAEFF